MFDSMFGRSFNSAKCKTLLKLAVSRIKLLKNKRDIQLKQMRRDLAQLLQTSQEPSARIRVEHIIREQNIMAAYEIIELFCELIAVRLPIIESQRECPIDLREAISSVIFAAPRCADLHELLQIRNLFASKYGKEFVASAAELRPDCGVNRRIIEKLSVRAPSGEIKLKLMKEIAAEQNVDWDPAESEGELLKLPEDLLEGPNRLLGSNQFAFTKEDSLSAIRIPISETAEQMTMPEVKNPHDPPAEGPVRMDSSLSHISTSSSNVLQKEKFQNEKQFIPFVLQAPEVFHAKDSNSHLTTGSFCVAPSFKQGNEADVNDIDAVVQTHAKVDASVKSVKKDHSPFLSENYVGRHVDGDSHKDIFAVATAAAESAERAAAAARVAASLAHGKPLRADSSSESEDEVGSSSMPRSEAKFHGDHLSEDGHMLDNPVLETPSDSYPKTEYLWRTESIDKRGPETSNRGQLKHMPTTDAEDEPDSPRNESISPPTNQYPFGSWAFSEKKQRSDLTAERSQSQTDNDNYGQSTFAKSILKPSVQSGIFNTPKFDDSPTSVNHGRQIKPEFDTQSHSEEPAPGHLTSTDSAGSKFQQNGSFKAAHIHPNLPDFDDLSARFASLKSRR
eukprot:c25212_g1_i1 orf=284-2140(-)